MYIQFNCWAVFFLIIHNLNIFSTADSDLTNTNYFLLHFSWCWLFHSAHEICKQWHWINMSVHNAINRTTTILTLLKLHHADNMNNKLFPSSVLIIWITQFFSCIMNWMTVCWQPQNSASTLNISFNLLIMFICHNCFSQTINALSCHSLCLSWICFCFWSVFT